MSIPWRAFALLLALSATVGSRGTSQPKNDAGLDEIRMIEVLASRYQFEPATVSVRQGERIRLNLRSADRTHSFAIKAYGIKVTIPRGGDVVSVDFVANQPGTFDFTCADYCGSGHDRMKGKLVVAAPGE